jgi:hypothetical protein
MAAQRRSLLELPGETLAQIAKHSSPKAKGPLLRVSAGLRNAVLCSLSRIHLDLGKQQPDDSNYQSLTRLLGRACCNAASGLVVKLAMDKHCHVALPVLLTPALEVQGWHNVHRLEVRVDHPDSFIWRTPPQL